MERNALPPESHDDLVLYALGALEAEAAQAVAERLQDDPDAAATVTALTQVVDQMGHQAPAVTPPPRLKATLLDRIQTTPQVAASSDVHTAFPDLTALDWEASDHPGVSFHWLRQDPTTGTAAAFVRVEPGARHVDHRHPGGEDCLVLQGGFRDRRGQYQAGDFVYYEPGSVHHDFQALPGEPCILFIIAHGGLEPLPSASLHERP